MGTEFLFLKNMERVSGNSCTASWIYLLPLNCTPKIAKDTNFAFVLLQ